MNMRQFILLFASAICFPFADAVVRDLLKLSGEFAPQGIEEIRMAFLASWVLVSGVVAAAHGGDDK